MNKGIQGKLMRERERERERERDYTVHDTKKIKQQSKIQCS